MSRPPLHPAIARVAHAALALAACAAPRPRVIPEAGPRSTVRVGDRACLPLELDRADRPYVHGVRVNGSAPLTMLIDTGNGYDVSLEREVAPLPPSTPHVSMGLAGSVPTRRSVADSVTLAGASVTGALVEVDYGHAIDPDAQTGVHKDGVLGARFLRHFVVQLDYARECVRFLAAVPALGPGTVTLPMLGGSLESQAYVLATLSPGDGSRPRARLFLDTGFGGTLIFVTHYAEGPALRALERKERGEGVGTGGGFSPTRVRLPALSLGTVTLRRIDVGLGHDTAGFLGTRGLDGDLGAEVLSRFVVTLDYPGRRVFLTPTARAAEPFPITRSSFRLAADSADVAVVRVEATALSASDLRVGDTVAAIDGKPISSLRAATLALRGAGPHLLRVRRAGRTLDLPVTTREVP